MNYIAYYRVSTKDQGKSGLSLSAQQQEVTQYINSLAGNLIEQFTEVESGGAPSREILNKAIELASTTNSTLVVKSLDRLTRDGYRTAVELEELNIPYIESSSPNDPQLVKDIKMAIAKDERLKIKKRTQDAIDQIKLNILTDGYHITKAGKKITRLGNPKSKRPSKQAIKASAEVRSTNAYNNPANKKAGDIIVPLVNLGKSYSYVANYLNDLGYVTINSKSYSKVQVMRLYKRYSGDYEL